MAGGVFLIGKGGSVLVSAEAQKDFLPHNESLDCRFLYMAEIFSGFSIY